MTASAKEVIPDAIHHPSARKCDEYATAILAALDAAGYVVVPREPTPAMVAAAWDTIAPEKKRLGIARLGPGPGTTDVYRAMIAAQERKG